MDLVKDYLKCHSLQSSVEAFCKAIVIAVEQSKLCMECSGLQLGCGEGGGGGALDTPCQDVDTPCQDIATPCQDIATPWNFRQ